MSEPGPSRSTRRYRGVSPEARRAERRARLLEAAYEVFGAGGTATATVKQICAAAGLTERYFYESFKNQGELFGAVYDDGVDRMREAIVSALGPAEPTSDALARAGMTAFFQTLRDDPNLARILLVEVYGSTYDLERLYQRGVADFADLARGIIDAQGLLPEGADLDPGLISTAVVGAAIHLALRWYLSDYPESVETMVAHGMALLHFAGSDPGASAS